MHFYGLPLVGTQQNCRLTTANKMQLYIFLLLQIGNISQQYLFKDFFKTDNLALYKRSHLIEEELKSTKRAAKTSVKLWSNIYRTKYFPKVATSLQYMKECSLSTQD